MLGGDLGKEGRGKPGYLEWSLSQRKNSAPHLLLVRMLPSNASSGVDLGPCLYQVPGPEGAAAFPF